MSNVTPIDKTSPPKPNTTQQVTAVSAIAGLVLSALLAAGIIKQPQADSIKQTIDKIDPIAEQLIERLKPAIQDAIDKSKKQDAAPVIVTPVVPVNPVQPVNPPIVQPVEPPKPIVNPTPINPPAPIVVPVISPKAIVTIRNAARQLIDGTSVSAGSLFIVSSSGSIRGENMAATKWSVTSESAQLVSIPDCAGGVLEYVGTLSAGGSATFTLAVAGDGQVDIQSLKVTCLTAPQPPPIVTPAPVVNPVPVNPPAPDPQVVDRPVYVYLVYDPKTVTSDAAKIINDTSWWTAFASVGNKWQFFTIGTQTAKGQAAIKAASSRGIQAPFLAVADLTSENVTGVVALPKTVDGIRAAIRGAK